MPWDNGPFKKAGPVEVAATTQQTRQDSTPTPTVEPQIAQRQQAAQVLVSNFGQTSDTGVGIGNLAQPFTTGGNGAGYTLTSVEIDTSFSTIDPVSDLPTLKVLSGSVTGTEVATLTKPSSITGQILTYAAPAPVTLAANTKYWLVISDGRGQHWLLVPVNPVDATSAPGWTLSPALDASGPSGFRELGGGSHYFKIRVNGTVTTTAPAFTNETETLTVVENAAPGATVGTVPATDPDGDTLTYSVSGTDVDAFNEDFALNASTGEIKVRTTGTVDYEDKPTYSVTLSVTDGEDASGNTETTATIDDTVSVTINVTDVKGTADVSLATFVSNANQSDVDTATSITADTKRAQIFRTGSEDGVRAYLLTSVKFTAWALSTRTDTPEPVITINTANGEIPSDEVLYTLSRAFDSPSIGTSKAEITFAAPAGSVLEPSTDYFIVFTTTTGDYSVKATNSPEVDSPHLPGWGIPAGYQYFLSSSNPPWQTLTNERIKMALHGKRAVSLPEPAGSDLTGDIQNMRQTTGLLIPGDPVTGMLTRGEDSGGNLGRQGDYYRLDVQEGHYYRLQAFFKDEAGGSVPITRGGSLVVDFYDHGKQRNSGLSSGRDHNRDDGYAIVTFIAGRGQEYYAKVKANDLYYSPDDPSRRHFYHGKYHLQLTDITGVERLAMNVWGGHSTREDKTIGTTTWATDIRIGTHEDGYRLDRLEVFIIDPEADAKPVVTLRRQVGGDPGDTVVCTFMQLEGYASGILTPERDVADILYPEPGCPDLFPTTTPERQYWLVFEAGDTTKPYDIAGGTAYDAGGQVDVGVVDGPAEGWRLSGDARSRVATTDPPGAWAFPDDHHIFMRLWGTPLDAD